MSSSQQRGSARLRQAAGYVSKIVKPQVLERRMRHRLDRLNKINFNEDPNPNLDNFVIVDDEEAGFHKKKKRPRHTKKRQRRPLAAIREDQKLFVAPPRDTSKTALPREATPASLTAFQEQAAPRSRYPRRHFCAVSGFPARYMNTSDGARHDSLKSMSTYLAAQKG